MDNSQSIRILSEVVWYRFFSFYKYGHTIFTVCKVSFTNYSERCVNNKDLIKSDILNISPWITAHNMQFSEYNISLSTLWELEKLQSGNLEKFISFTTEIK